LINETNLKGRRVRILFEEEKRKANDDVLSFGSETFDERHFSIAYHY